MRLSLVKQSPVPHALGDFLTFGVGPSSQGLRPRFVLNASGGVPPKSEGTVPWVALIGGTTAV